LGVLDNRFIVTLQITVTAETSDEAEEHVKEFISEGIAVLEDENRNFVHDYDITDSEPAEVF